MKKRTSHVLLPILHDKTLFREWFSRVLKKAAEAYPCAYNYMEINRKGEYDCSDEQPMLQEFYFGEDVTWDLETVKQRVREYVQSGGESNPYLRLQK